MDLPIWAWVAFNALVLLLLAFDLGVLHRKAREIGVREALALSGGYIAIALAFNAFNYATLGAAGFKAAVAVAGSCPTWQLIYSDLDDALARLAREWPAVVEQGRERLLQTAPVAGGATS